MSRYETGFRNGRPIDLVVALRTAGTGPADHHAAIACVLSASSGWRDASRRVGGAFAKGAWLKNGKEK